MTRTGRLPKFEWVVKGQLARGPRPGFEGLRRRQIRKSKVKKWARKARKRYGIRSIICLLDDNHLKYYESLRHGLLNYYRSKGFHLKHIRVPHLRQLTDKHLRQVWNSYQSLPKPVFVHCSAGRGRTGKAVAHIKTEATRGLGGYTASRRHRHNFPMENSGGTLASRAAEQ